MGRPSSYEPAYAAQAEKLCRLGATDIEVADFFEVERTTIWRWSQKHEEFCNALKAGKAFADERVERSLYAKAIGYSHDAVKIFMPASHNEPVYAPYREHVAPDTTAAIFWLKNRRPEQWRDVNRTEHSGEVGVRNLSDEELNARLAALLTETGGAPAAGGKGEAGTGKKGSGRGNGAVGKPH